MGRYKRRKPYTVRGIKRLRCVRCGAQAYATWQVCADGRTYRPVCKACDVALNALVLEFMRLPQAAALLASYREQVNLA